MRATYRQTERDMNRKKLPSIDDRGQTDLINILVNSYLNSYLTLILDVNLWPWFLISGHDTYTSQKIKVRGQVIQKWEW